MNPFSRLVPRLAVAASAACISLLFAIILLNCFGSAASGSRPQAIGWDSTPAAAASTGNNNIGWD